MQRIALVALSLLFTAACGGSDSTRPSASAQVDGVWSVTERITSVTGGECLGTTLQAAVGTTGAVSLQISQSGSQLTARGTSSADGSSCDYTGTAGATSIALNITSCTTPDAKGVICSNGALRDLGFLAGGFNGSINGNSMSGTGGETYNVFIAGTSTGVGTLTFATQFTATKR